MFSMAEKNRIKWFLTFLILVDFMGTAMVVVIFPHLFLSKESVFLSSTMSQQARLILLGLFLAIYPIGQFFGSTILGKFSDYKGRKSLLTISIIGTLFGFILSAVSLKYNLPALLLVGRLMAGIFAGNVAIAQASLADISVDEKTKTQNLTYAQMAMGSAYIIGPIFGGILSDSNIIGWFNASTPFIFFILLLTVMLFLTRVIYKETLLNKNTNKLQITECFESIVTSFSMKGATSFFMVWFVFVSGWWLFESFMPTFLLQKFSLSTAKIGYLLAFNGALYASFQYFVVRPTSQYFQSSTMAKYGCVLAGIAICSMVETTNIFQIYIAMAFFVMAMAYAIPGLITSISNQFSKDNQGQAMGMISSIQAMATVGVMLVGGFVNAINNNLTVIIGGLMIVLSGLIFMLVTKKINVENVISLNK